MTTFTSVAALRKFESELDNEKPNPDTFAGQPSIDDDDEDIVFPSHPRKRKKVLDPMINPDPDMRPRFSGDHTGPFGPLLLGEQEDDIDKKERELVLSYV
jgi:hypothetical protein